MKDNVMRLIHKANGSVSVHLIYVRTLSMEVNIECTVCTVYVLYLLCVSCIYCVCLVSTVCVLYVLCVLCVSWIYCVYCACIGCTVYVLYVLCVSCMYCVCIGCTVCNHLPKQQLHTPPTANSIICSSVSSARTSEEQFSSTCAMY